MKWPSCSLGSQLQHSIHFPLPAHVLVVEGRIMCTQKGGGRGVSSTRMDKECMGTQDTSLVPRCLSLKSNASKPHFPPGNFAEKMHFEASQAVFLSLLCHKEL